MQTHSDSTGCVTKDKNIYKLTDKIAVRIIFTAMTSVTVSSGVSALWKFSFTASQTFFSPAQKYLNSNKKKEALVVGAVSLVKTGPSRRLNCDLSGWS